MKTIQPLAALGITESYLGLPSSTEDFYKIEYYCFYYNGLRIDEISRLQLIALCFSRPEEKAEIDIRFLRLGVDDIDEDYNGWLNGLRGFLLKRDDYEALINFLQTISESLVEMDHTVNRECFTLIDSARETMPTPFEVLFTSNNYFGNRESPHDAVRYEKIYISSPLKDQYRDDLAITIFTFSRDGGLEGDTYLALIIYANYHERYKDVGSQIYDGDTISLSKVSALRFSKQSLQEFLTLFRNFVSSTHWQQKMG